MLSTFRNKPISIRYNKLRKKNEHRCPLFFDAFLFAQLIVPYSALMLVCARLRHVVSTVWGTKRYMSMKALNELQDTMIPVG